VAVKSTGSEGLCSGGERAPKTAQSNVAGFLFVPGPSLVRAIKAISSRVDSARGGEFVELAGATIRTVSRGVIGISALQALLAGIAFKLAGVPGASMLTFLVLAFGIG
jgi:predicted PurR-regulated permease PerM